MKNLRLLLLLIAVAIAYSAFTWRGEQGKSEAGAAAPGLPIGFTSTIPSRIDHPVKAVFSLEPSDNYYSEPWPFKARSITFACADGMLNVVEGGGIYAALNGYTSGFSGRYRVVNGKGESFKFLRTATNQTFKDAGLVRYDATEIAIGGWWSALNNRLGKECS